MPSSRKVKRCWYCSTILGKHNATLDHVVPLCKNGSNKSSNLVDACLSCNHEKNSFSLAEFRVLVAYRKGLIPEPNMKFYGESKLI